MGYQDLALAIVEQAVEDYKQNKAEKKSNKRLTEFFKGEWCNLLLKNTPFNGEEILMTLER